MESDRTQCDSTVSDNAKMSTPTAQRIERPSAEMGGRNCLRY